MIGAFVSGGVIGCFIGVALMACLKVASHEDDVLKGSDEDEYL